MDIITNTLCIANI